MMKAKANLLRTFLVVLPVVLVAVAVALFGVGLRTAQPQTTPTYYKVQALGPLPGSTANEPYSRPHGINDRGHVVGESNFSGSSEGGTVHAFLYENGVMRDLDTLGGPSSVAHAINNSGQVVGYSQTEPDDWYGPEHAFLYENGQMKDLGTLPGDTYSRAYGINSSGQVVGYSHTASGKFHAFLYDSTNGMIDLGTLGGPSSGASAINDSGQVVGWSDTASGERHAFLYKDGQMKDLGTLGGGSNSGASAINNSGQAVGNGTYGSSGYYHAFLYRGEGPMQDLGVLASGENRLSWAADINDFDQIVGSSDNDYNNLTYLTAFLYQNEEMIDLSARLHPDNNGNVWHLDSANGINNNGQIVTEGSRKETDGSYWYSGLLLTPTSDNPPPADDTEAPSPPSIASPQNNSYDTDGSFSVSGSAEASSTVELFDGTTSKGTTTADSSSGAWRIALSGLSEGAHTYSAKATDAAGNTSSASNTVTVTVDKTPPKVDTVVPKEDATTGVAPGDDVTATFSERMQAASVKSAFKLYKKGTTSALGASVSCDAECRIATLNPSANLKRGTTYKAVVSVGAQDLAGNSLDQDASLSGSQQKEWFFKVG